MGWLSDLAQSITDSLWAILTALGEVLQDVFWWLVTACFELALFIMEPVAGWFGDVLESALGPEWSDAVGVVGQYVGFVNAFLPLSYGATLLSAYISVRLAVSTLRFLKKTIPSQG